MSEIWDENFVGDEVCANCGEPLLDCVCVDDAECDLEAEMEKGDTLLDDDAKGWAD